MNKPKTKTLVAIKEYVMISLGLLLGALAWNFFLFPHQIAAGGATGVAAIVMYATKGLIPEQVQEIFNMLGMESVGGGLPATVTFFIMNSILLVISIKTLGLQFSIRSIYGVVCLSVWLWIPFRDVYENITGAPFPIFDVFMSTIIAGIMLGLGLGIAFSNNGSSGGTDIIAKIISKYKTITLGKALLLSDVLIICSSGFLPDGGIENVIYGLIIMFISATTVDMYLNGVRQSVQFFIFSKKYQEIADAIATKANRGVTFIHAEGWYSKQNTKIVTVIARKDESTKIFKIIKEIDPDAFISQSASMGVYGKGFDKIGQN